MFEPGIETDRLIELVVFGDDLTANTDERIVEAISSSDLIWSDKCKVPYKWALSLENEDRKQMELLIWENRDGQEWQAEWEEYVTNWRADPRPFTTSDDERLGHAIIREMGKKGFSFECGYCEEKYMAYFKEGQNRSTRLSNVINRTWCANDQFNVAVANAAL